MESKIIFLKDRGKIFKCKQCNDHTYHSVQNDGARILYICKTCNTCNWKLYSDWLTYDLRDITEIKIGNLSLKFTGLK